MTFISSWAHWLAEFRKSPEAPLRVFYLTYFGALGAMLPYLPLHFSNLGLSGVQIGILSSLIMAANMGMAPVWTAISDFFGRHRSIFIFNLIATTISFALLVSARSFTGVALVVFIFAVFRSPLVPMANVMVFERLAGRGEEYGRIRIWGSAGYIILALIVGKLVDVRGTSVVIYAAVLAYALCAIFSTRGLHPALGEQAHAKMSDLLTLMKRSRFMVFLICSFLVGLSGSPYIVFFSISMSRMGMPQSIVGLSWTAAVLAEIFFMANSPRIIRRFSVEGLLVFSFLTWGLRWYLMSLAASPLPVISVHLLHGITFGLYYPVAMNFLDREVPSLLKNTGQGLFSAVSYGMGGVVGNLLVGVLYEGVGLMTLYRLGALTATVAAALFALYMRGKGVVAAS